MAKAQKRSGKNELWGIGLLALGVFVLMSLISYHPDDLSFFTSHPSDEVRNLCGVVGAFVAGLIRAAIGLASYLLVGCLFLWAIARFQGKAPLRRGVKPLMTILFLVSISSLLANLGPPGAESRVYRGGMIGMILGEQAIRYFGTGGAFLVLATIGFLSFLLVTELAAWPLVEKSAAWLVVRLKEVAPLRLFPTPVRLHRKATVSQEGPTIRVNAPEPARPGSFREAGGRPASFEAGGPTRPEAGGPTRPGAGGHLRPEPPVIKTLGTEVAPKVFPKVLDVPSASPAMKEKPKTKVPELTPYLKPGMVLEPTPAPKPGEPFAFPPLTLLNPPTASGIARAGKEWAQMNAKILEESLKEFGIEARVAEVEVGPVITRYEVEPAPGVKVQKITTLSDDLALVLKAPSVRIIAPIPGKARIGIEAPNPASTLVTLREVLESSEFKESTSKLTLAFGQDAAGHPLVADLGQMPHLLIAGTTGSGKTVCVNSLITSILFRATPEEVRFLMVDPKMVELSVFNGIPHLILPVLTEPKKVPLALAWVVQEMETRYRLFARLGVRNIEAYHEREAKGDLPKEEVPDSLPYLVVIIDELADLMLVAQAEVERTIARLAHLSRAVGIHMVLATQRPSVDVLTGVVKANFPARISFQVASKVDSRTVLDTMGAEKLLGKGDLLFMQPGSSKLIRAQGTLVTDEEIERVVEYLKTERQPQYDTSILESEVTKFPSEAVHEADPLYPEAVRIVVETGLASVSLLQRRMRLGYGRAARILDRMEVEGIVGPIRGAKPREVYFKEVPSVLDDRRST